MRKYLEWATKPKQEQLTQLERNALDRIKQTFRLGKMDVDAIEKGILQGFTVGQFRDLLFRQLDAPGDLGQILTQLRDAGLTSD